MKSSTDKAKTDSKSNIYIIYLLGFSVDIILR